MTFFFGSYCSLICIILLRDRSVIVLSVFALQA